jgi:flagellar operon protein
MSAIDPITLAMSGLRPIVPQTIPSQAAAKKPDASKTSDFGNLLEQTVRDSEPVKFSAHAQNRLLHRQISLTEPQMSRLEKGVSEAAGKGAQASLVMLDNLALIVSVRNRTVVTALDQAQNSSHVFTQIDSAVIA